MNKQVMKLSSFQQKLWKVILVISCPFLTILLSRSERIFPLFLGALLALLVAFFFAFKKISCSSFHKTKLIFACFLGCYFVKQIFPYALANLEVLQTFLERILPFSLALDTIIKIIGVFALPSTIYIVYLFLEKILPIVVSFFQSFEKSEKWYFLFVLIVGVLFTFVITYQTTAFTMPVYQDMVHTDVIYTTDSGVLAQGNAFFNVSYVENDIRQPLFGIFALPFSFVAKLLSEGAFFLRADFAYPILLTMIQYLLLAVTTIMLGRMLLLEEKEKKYFYLLFSVSFPYLLFSFVLEQYAISLFYLILAFYVYQNSSKKINYTYLGAVGTLITSGIIVPVITKFKNIKQWIHDVFCCFLAFLSIFIIGGQIPQLFTVGDRLHFLLGFTKNVPFSNKIYQFTNFVKGLFFAPLGKVSTLHQHPTYQLILPHAICILGVIILGICVLSFVLNRKNKMARISFLWILFSFFLLVIVGWGTKENGLILYSLYFAWAFYILTYLFFKKIFKNPKIFYASICLVSCVMLVVNFFELGKIIEFALSYF